MKLLSERDENISNSIRNSSVLHSVGMKLLSERDENPNLLDNVYINQTVRRNEATL